MSRVASARSAGSIVRRFRESQGLSRATLSRETGIGARTIYALEQGESRNFGLENYQKLLDALGLSMSVDLNNAQKPAARSGERPLPLPEYELADIWKLDKDRQK